MAESHLGMDSPGPTALERQLAEWETFADLADAMRAEVRVVVVRIVDRAGSRAVVAFFRHDDFPEVLFAYRCLWLGPLDVR